MIFNIDLKPTSSIAAIDDIGNSISYGGLIKEINIFKNIITERELVFCLCENVVGSLIGYVSLYENKDIALLLGANTDRELLENLIQIYQPTYFWLPKKYSNDFQIEIVHEAFEYVLGKTDYGKKTMHKDLALLLTTSGSTGSPKLVKHKYGNIESNAKIIAEVFDWNSKENAICILPMQYSMGLNVINSHLYSGGTLLLVSNNLTSPSFWKFIKENEATSFTGVPFSYELLMKLRFTKMNLPHLNTISEGGGKLSESLFIELANYAENNNKRFFATFGTTETSARMSYLSPKLAKDKCCSIGKSIPGSIMFLIDDSGNVINENEVEGELCYRGPNVTMGYANCIEDLAKGDDLKGEYRTGDIAKRDNDGFYYIVGRKSRFLKLFGFRVSLDQCELLITEKYDVECACTGDDKRMEIFLCSKINHREVIEYISKKTGLMASVFNINVVNKIPRNSSGKVIYKELI